ncbi:MAG: deoxyribonuclease IV [Syntrophaceae bacterium]|nr:deoxyribonuclease IV [Syntrophaceae bacterium]
MDGHTIPLLGAHVSIAGGLEKALLRGDSLGCATIQIFTKSASRWEERILEKPEISWFRETRKRTGIDPVISHACYLINLASPDREIYLKSLNAMVYEIRRCEQLGVDLLVLHPGHHRGAGVERGIAGVVEALNTIHAETTGALVKIALETTAGQGTCLGSSFEEIARIMEQVKENSRLAFCLDTCHVFVAGYNLRTREDYHDLFTRIDSTIGKENLMVIHLNDSKREMGSRVDRHENIGAGMIGEGLFRLIMGDTSLAGIPKIIETPSDLENLRLLKSFV